MTRSVTLLGRTVQLDGDPNDIYFDDLPDEIDDDVLYLFDRIVPDDLVAVDVGSNIGLHALALSALAPQGQIHAFEASPVTARYLSGNLVFNGATNVTAHPIALSSAPGELSFFFNDRFLAGSTQLDKATPIAREYMSGGEVRIPATTLDAFVAEAGLDRIDLMKIDVEGYDLDVLAGGAGTIARMQPAVIMEFSSFALTTHRQTLPADALAEIRSIFDRVYVIERWGLVRELLDDELAWDLLWENAHLRPNQDVLGVFEGSRLFGAIDELAQRRRGSKHAPLEPTRAELDLEELTGRHAELVQEHKEVSERLHEVDALNAELRSTLSWRITRPLRAIRTRMSKR